MHPITVTESATHTQTLMRSKIHDDTVKSLVLTLKIVSSWENQMKYLCRHALSTDCDLSKAPRRRTDGAIVLDMDFYVVKLYTETGSTKLVRRRSGNIERQFRINMGKLPIGYRQAFLSFLGPQDAQSPVLCKEGCHKIEH